MSFDSIQSIDKTIRDIKQILRTPISIKDDGPEENLPNLLMRALGRGWFRLYPFWHFNYYQIIRVCLFAVVDSLYYHIGTSENVIPTYGLFISVLKEAWNYSIFKDDEREVFNIWREILSTKYDTYGVLRFHQLFHCEPSFFKKAFSNIYHFSVGFRLEMKQNGLRRCRWIYRPICFAKLPKRRNTTISKDISVRYFRIFINYWFFKHGPRLICTFCLGFKFYELILWTNGEFGDRVCELDLSVRANVVPVLYHSVEYFEILR